MTAEPVPEGRGRNSQGRFTRTVANMDRDRAAAEDVERGATYDEVAARFGFDSRQSAFRAVQRVRRENTMFSGETREIRQRQLDELAQVRRQAWELVRNPLPAISRTGKVVTDEDGAEVPDVAGVAAMLALIVKASEREARLCGTEMPRRSVSLTGKSEVGSILAFMDSVNPADLNAAVREMERRVEEARRQADDAEAHHAAIPGAVEE